MKWYYYIPLIGLLIDLYRQNKCQQRLRQSNRIMLNVENFNNNL